jgi:tetratricopeptide (TPR) repeat protein
MTISPPPSLPSADYFLADQYLQAGRYEEAKGIYCALLADANPKADIFHRLSMIALAQDDLVAAFDYEQRAHHDDSHKASYVSNLAEMERRRGNKNEALEWAQKAVALDPSDATGFYNLGNVWLDLRKYSQAEQFFLQAIALQPNHGLAWNNLGSVRQQLGDEEGALEAYTMATQINAQHAEAQCNRGSMLFRRHEYGAARVCMELALQSRPSFIDAKNNLKQMVDPAGGAPYLIALATLAIGFQNQQRHDAVIELLHADMRQDSQAIEMAQLWHLLGISNYKLNQFGNAFTCYQEALTITPKFTGALNSLGFLLQELRLYEDARQAFEDAVRIDPQFDMARLNLGMIQLKLGLWAEGWENYECRWTGSAEAIQQIQRKPNLPLPLWDGTQHAANQRLLVLSEQGFGDTLQFCRFLTSLQPQFSKVSFQAPDSLRRLLEWSFSPSIEILSAVPSQLNTWTSYIPLLSLPRVYKTTLESIPSTCPYLKVPPVFQEFWSRRLEQQTFGRLKIGIAWSGRKTLQYDKRRSISFAQLAPLFAIDGVDWICLQKWDQDINLDLVNLAHWFDWTEELGDFADTAALIQNLDLVVTVDSAIAHLAGALNQPVYLMNRFDGEWRWLCNQEQSPWYPSMRIFNQAEFDNWDFVIAAVKQSILGLTP